MSTKKDYFVQWDISYFFTQATAVAANYPITTNIKYVETTKAMMTGIQGAIMTW